MASYCYSLAFVCCRPFAYIACLMFSSCRFILIFHLEEMEEAPPEWVTVNIHKRVTEMDNAGFRGTPISALNMPSVSSSSVFLSTFSAPFIPFSFTFLIFFYWTL
ncbi:hypothetical protein BJ165DRAFT_654679 [Panaeolus papilionaceus]|nr:hypothetical protein BJ165DRAFT_654679 [Panaeolus papilionaceus]